MKSVIIVGIGKLGIRHLEAILLCGIPSTICVVDKNMEMLKKAEDLSTELTHFCHLQYSTELPKDLSFDLGIIATDSRHRFEITSYLLQKNHVRNVLLEKIIFPISNQYLQFHDIIEKLGCNCFVNLPRRMFSHYKLLREHTLNAKKFQVTIKGSSWGLLSNSLHFVDLIHYLFEVKCDNVDSTEVNDFFSSKRIGYLEANGSIEFNFSSKGKAIIICEEGNFEGISIDLLFDSKQVIIKERSNGDMQFSWGLTSLEIFPLMVTETTSIFWKQIVENKACELPSYNDIYLEHLLFIASFEEKNEQVIKMNNERIWLT